MKRYLTALARYGILCAILAFGTWYVIHNYDRFVSEINISAVNLSLLVFLGLLTLLWESLRLKIQMKKLGADLSVPAAWHIFTVMQAVNHLVIKAGTFSAGYYISRRYRISFHAYCAFVMTYVVVMVMSSGIVGLCASMIAIVSGAETPAVIPLLFVAIVAACAGFIVLARLPVPIPGKPLILYKLISAWREIYTDYKMILTLLLVESLYFMTCSLRFYLAISMLSVDIGFLDAVVIVSVGNFLRIATFIPGGLGVAEVASGWTAALIGGDAGLSGLAAGFDRLIYVVLLMLFGGIAFLTLSGRKEFHRPAEGDAKDEMV